MGLNWNEIKSRALLFSKTWADACNEDSQAKPFWIDFFEIFGITNKRVATFELNVKKLGGAQGFVDLFWPGVLLVEHKSRGKSLDNAVDQALGYLHHLPERDLPQLVVTHRVLMKTAHLPKKAERLPATPAKRWRPKRARRW